MNRAMKASLINSLANPFVLRAALFHSTPVLDRRRRTHWDSSDSAYRGSSKRPSYYSRRYRKLHSKQELLRNVGAFAEHLFQSWQYDHDEFDPSSSQGSSWFRRDDGARGFNGSRTNKKGGGRRGFEFCEDDDEVETIFRSAYGGGNGYFYRSFIHEEPQRSSSGYWSFVNEEPQRSSSGYYKNHHKSWNWRHQNEDEYDSSTESDSAEPDLTSDRLALGLSGSGPLSLDDVKNAYRACALKWHPDRHKGSSKAVAEEKFKVCSAAYQSICDKLALD